MSEIHRTPAEEFEYRQGYKLEYPPVRYRPEPPAEDDISELYYKVRALAKELGHDKADFLRRLHEAEATIEQAEDYVYAYQPPQSYHDMIADYEAAYEWEGE